MIGEYIFKFSHEIKNSEDNLFKKYNKALYRISYIINIH